MDRKYSTLQIGLRIVGASILILGLGVAALVYYYATDDANGVSGCEFVNGTGCTRYPEEDRRYIHDLELYGGQAAVLADEFNRWISSLWRGKRQAYTLGVLAIGISLSCFLVADHLPDNSLPEQTKDQDD
ncbi:MAG: hypothetical protein P4L70_04675 [Parasulfuritortus sp.]|nr:hypothetical protein [Parasulfuritortus sp.]